MLLAEELKNLTDKFKAAASEKELVFYQFLNNSPLPYPHDKKLSEQEQVIFAAFCTDSPDTRELADKLRGTKPIRGIHYSNNLIELSAFATLDYEKELDNLKSYASSHSTRDYYVLNNLFSDILTYPPEPSRPIDTVAVRLLSGELSLDDKAALIEAIKDSEDLLDVYVISGCYFHLLERQPATQYKSDLSVLSREFAKVIQRVDIAVRIALTFGGGYLLYRLYIWLIPIIYNTWQTSEPIFTIIEIGLFLIEILILILISAQPDKLSFIKVGVRFVGTIVLRIMGINRRIVEKRIEDYQDDTTMSL